MIINHKNPTASQKAAFYFEKYSFCKREVEECKFGKPVTEEEVLKCLEFRWEQTVKWYREKYEQAFRESLTLEQLYILDH